MYLTFEELSEQYIDNFRQKLGYEFNDFMFNSSCLKYTSPSTCEKYIEDLEIDGELYEKRACWSDEEFWIFQTGFLSDCFKFYKYYRVADIPNHLVSEYENAKCLYSTDVDIEEDFDFLH